MGSPERRNRRNRERRSRVVVTGEIWLSGRRAVEIEVTKKGTLHLTVLLDGRSVSGADKMRAADSLRDYLPRLTHEQRYQLLWGRHQARGGLP
jgi:hypothetical protein